VGYGSLEQMDGWAWDFQQSHARQVTDCPRLVGFCLAGRREFFEQVGGLDERFGLGFCDDDDLCRRATAAGWRTVIACGSFVHHWGSASFHQLDDADALLQHNLSLLADKYREDTHETA
jgi:GT2 family glycosyltransferase